MKSQSIKWLFVFPALFVYTVFRVLPILASFAFAGIEWKGIGSARFVGLANFGELFGDALFYTAVLNNVKLMVFFVAASVAFGFLLAYLIDMVVLGKGLFRVTLFIPVLISNLVAALLWRWMYNPSYGLINLGLKMIGLEGWQQNWLGDSSVLVTAIIIVTIWRGYDRSMVMFLAGLQGIPEEIKEAAYIDGAKEWQTAVYVTIPMLKPIASVVIVLALINAFRMFDIFYIMTNQGVVESADVLSTLLYKNAMKYMRFGYASAIAVVQFALVMIVSVFYYRSFGERERSRRW